ncbi:succinylglutamate desuccinylase/aspartoacylase family protein [Mesorhizobium captivum]|uniref:succinylglutamate desuccinylase/aspartoacylase family protein n=1 Tax=Mesorhizobium captivum TaxID=3072319 RepID=UPI002A23DE48|nr:succinylglutamate desuccinylase/aspartoacylase family protein [Mesorhizobium sp. VK3C]MDX8450233.1 succinylglutamate desuccinylase/aspartoacylase family protein [Mesorhizobium sp. VK3C]
MTDAGNLPAGTISEPKSSRIWTDIDFSVDGKQCGYLRLPVSSHESAYGWIPIPVAVIRNKSGPRVLLIAGNHGDEWEGQILLMNFLRQVRQPDVRGTIIILSAANAPAVEANRRVSPLDEGNLNRCFPGKADGTPTWAIAHFIETHLLPGTDLVCDFHSGGSSLEYLPSTVIVRPKEEQKMKYLLSLVHQFGLPVGFITDAPTGGDQSLWGACDRTGVLCLSTELGGAGTVNLQALRAAEVGLLRLLQHVGALSRDQEVARAQKVQLFSRHPARDYLYSPAPGVFEPHVGLGQRVHSGQVAGVLHSTEAPWREPDVVYFRRSGYVLCRRVPARTRIGDCLFNTADELSVEQLLSNNRVLA